MSCKNTGQDIKNLSPFMVQLGTSYSYSYTQDGVKYIWVKKYCIAKSYVKRVICLRS